MKFSDNFDRDFRWYLSVRHMFNFDGCAKYFDKKGNDIIVYNKNGASAKECFYKWDTNGKILPTKHPNILHTLLKTKGSVNLHIKMFAEDRANGCYPLIEFKDFCKKYKVPLWFIDSVEKQKFKHYKLD